MPSPGRGAGMRRREFLGLAAGATAAWPLVARAQQPAMPVIGFLGLGTLDEARRVFAFISRGLVEAGYVEGRNLSVQFRFADYHADRLPALANELAQAQVAAIITGSGPALSATRAATASIPVVFFTGFDPVASGFVTSLNIGPAATSPVFHPGYPPLLIKRIELLHELIPRGPVNRLPVHPHRQRLRRRGCGPGHEGGRKYVRRQAAVFRRPARRVNRGSSTRWSASVSMRS